MTRRRMRAGEAWSGERLVKAVERVKHRSGRLHPATQTFQALRIWVNGELENLRRFLADTPAVLKPGGRFLFIEHVAAPQGTGLRRGIGAVLAPGRLALTDAGQRSLLTKAAAAIAMPVLNAFKRRVDHRRFNGAALLGLRGLVFKSHGSADAFAFEQALARAYDAAHHQLLDNVKSRIAHAAPLMAQPGLAPEPAAAV